MPVLWGRRFRIEGARKLLFEAVYRATDKGLVREDDTNTDIDWEVAYGLYCEECGEDLSELAGF